MDLAYGPAHQDFREEVRGFLRTHHRQIPPSSGATRAQTLAWQSLLIEHGYAARTITRQFGGFGAEPDILQIPHCR